MNLWLSNNSCNRVFGSNIMLNLLSLPPTFKKILCCFLFCIQNYFNAIWIFLLHKISLTSRPFLKNSFNPLLILILFSTCWIFHISKTCYFPEQSAKVVKKVILILELKIAAKCHNCLGHKSMFVSLLSFIMCLAAHLFLFERSLQNKNKSR